MDATYYFYLNSIGFLFLLIIFLVIAGRGFMNNNIYLTVILFITVSFNAVMFLLTYKPLIYEKFIGLEYVLGFLSIPFFISFSRANCGLNCSFKLLLPYYIPAIVLFLLYLIYWLFDISIRSQILYNKRNFQSPFFNILDITSFIYFISALLYCLYTLYSSKNKTIGSYSIVFLNTRRQYALSVMWIFLFFGSLTVPLGLIGFGEPYQKYIVFCVTIAVFINVIYNSIVNPYYFLNFKKNYRNVFQDEFMTKSLYKKESKPEESRKLKFVDKHFINKCTFCVLYNLNDSNFDVNVFANKMNMSRMQLFRKMKTITNQTPSEFIRYTRIRKAAELLDQRYGNIAEVAYEVGFNNLSYFAKCFRECYGSNPSEYAHHKKEENKITS